MFAPLGNGRHAATVAGGTVARGAVLVQRFILVFSVFLRFSLLLLLFSLFIFFFWLLCWGSLVHLFICGSLHVSGRRTNNERRACGTCRRLTGGGRGWTTKLMMDSRCSQPDGFELPADRIQSAFFFPRWRSGRGGQRGPVVRTPRRCRWWKKRERPERFSVGFPINWSRGAVPPSPSIRYSSFHLEFPFVTKRKIGWKNVSAAATTIWADVGNHLRHCFVSNIKSLSKPESTRSFRSILIELVGASFFLHFQIEIDRIESNLKILGRSFSKVNTKLKNHILYFLLF